MAKELGEKADKELKKLEKDTNGYLGVKKPPFRRKSAGLSEQSRPPFRTKSATP